MLRAVLSNSLVCVQFLSEISRTLIRLRRILFKPPSPPRLRHFALELLRSA
jgi:hypothetical protein